MFGRRIEAQRRGHVELGLHVVEMFVALSKTLGPTEAVSAAVPHVHGVAAFDAARRVIDEIKRGCASGASWADEVAPSAAVGEARVLDGDEPLFAAERDDRVILGRIDHVARPKATDAHGRELVKKFAVIRVRAASGHGLEATLRLRRAQKRRSVCCEIVVTLAPTLDTDFCSDNIALVSAQMIWRCRSGVVMGMQMVFTDARELGPGIWGAVAPPHQISVLGHPKSVLGAKSILLVNEPTYDQSSLALRFDAAHLTILNLGTSSEVVIVGLPSASPAKPATPEKLPSDERGPGDEEYLALVRSKLHGPAREAAEMILREVRSRNPGDLIRGKRHNFSNTPDNFWYVIVQPTSQSLSITVRGKPDQFRPSPLEVTDDRPGYTRFKLRDPTEINSALAIIGASKRKLR